MKTELGSSYKEIRKSNISSREYPQGSGIASSLIMRSEEKKKVRFDDQVSPTKSVDLKGKKYEGYSSLSNKGYSNKFKTPQKESKKSLDDEFIHNLHQHIYYLEMQLKLLKDKGIDSKKGGLDALFSDGIPLNEHFLALKNKYKSEKKELEDNIKELEKSIAEIAGDNRNVKLMLESLSEEYENFIKNNDNKLIEKTDKQKEFICKLSSEKRKIAEIKFELDAKVKELNKIKSENELKNRVREKNKMITEKREEKNLKEEEDKNNEQIEYYRKKVIDASVELEKCKKTFDDITLIKNLNSENSELIKKEAALSSNLQIAEGKIAELENLRELNRKDIEEEILGKKALVKENELLKKELDNKNNLKENELQDYLKVSERHKIIELQNQIDIQSQEMDYFNGFLNELENKVKVLVDEKAEFQEKNSEFTEDIIRLTKEKEDQTNELQNLFNINEMTLFDIENTTKEYIYLQKNNKELETENDRIQAYIQELNVEIQKAQQKMQLNEILKDVDLDELKMLDRNNQAVNTTITNLVNKLESIDGKSQKQ